MTSRAEKETTLPDSDPNTGPRHEPERIYERDPDPAEAADRPLESRSSSEPLHATDEPDPAEQAGDPHHRLNTHVGDPDPDADSDPYRPPSPDDDDDRASGTLGSGQGAEDR
jgi:hypothetical protein